MYADIPACRGRPVLPSTIGTRPSEKLMPASGQILNRGDPGIFASADLTHAPRVCMPFVCIERPYKRLFPADLYDPMHSKLMQSRPKNRVNSYRKVFSNLTLPIWPQILKTRTRILLIFAAFSKLVCILSRDFWIPIQLPVLVFGIPKRIALTMDSALDRGV